MHFRDFFFENYFPLIFFINPMVEFFLYIYILFRSIEKFIALIGDREKGPKFQELWQV